MNIDPHEKFRISTEYGRVYRYMSVYPTDDANGNLHRVGWIVQNQDLKRK